MAEDTSSNYLIQMAFFMFLVFASVFFTSEAQQKQSSISRGTSLKASSNSSWLSSSGVYAFGFFKAGSGYGVGIFIAGIPQNTRVWGANQDYLVNYNTTLNFTSEGKLVLQSYKSQYYIGDSLIEASSASMLDSGNFGLYDSNGGILWQSFDHPTNALLPTQRLTAGKELVSRYVSYSTGNFRLKMKEDGNLLLFPVGTPDTSQYAYYESGTSGKNISLVFEDDGQVSLLDATGSNVMNMTGRYPRNDSVLVMRIDNDGLFRVYSYNLKQNGNRRTEWKSSVLRINVSPKFQMSKPKVK